MKILMVSPEIAPFSKVGGLGDMVGSLSKEMARLGHDVRVVTPLYGCVKPSTQRYVALESLAVNLGGGYQEHACVWEETLPQGFGAQIYFLEHRDYYDRHEIYAGPWGSHADNWRRFTFLARAALDLCHALDWYPDVVHCHDWTTGFIPVYLNTTDRNTRLGCSASVMTVHNLQHQGIFGKETFGFSGLPWDTFRPDGLEALGNVNMLKGGLYHATKITTVSPTYAKEICTPQYGCGLDDVLRLRAGDLIGVLNGIDTDVWNPATDRYLPQNYGPYEMDGKSACKEMLQHHFELEQNSSIPLFAAIARLYDQKGLDLLADIASSLVRDMRLQIVVLGSGDPALENRFRDLAAYHPGRIGVHIGYDERLSHLIEAGADFFLMPSRFEPCGLNQMYSMNYGTLPIVRATGGLVDTVEQYVENQGRGTGFLFWDPTPSALYYTIGWANSTFYDRPADFMALRRNAMTKNFSWSASAHTYEKVYGWAVDQRAAAF